MDMNNAFDEILKIQNKLDKNNTVNPKITVAGKECTLYHTGNKPSASDVGAVPLAGNTKDSPITADMYFANSKGLFGIDPNGNPVRLTVHSNGTNYFGIKDCPSMIRSSNNPQVMVGDNIFKIYHTGNKPSASDVGANSGLFSGSIPSMTDGWINGVDTVILNYNNCFHAQAMSYFQAPVDGFYRISGQVSVSGESALYYYKNSSSSPTGTVFHTSSDAKNRYEHFISPVIPLSQGDTLRFYANTSSAFSIKSLTIEKINGGI